MAKGAVIPGSSPGTATMPPFFPRNSKYGIEMTKIISHENAEHYTWGKVCDGWHFLKSSDLSVIQERVPPGGSEIGHYHQRSNQFFFVLAGEATMEIEGHTFLIKPQQGISVPPKVPHCLRNQGREDLSFIVVSAPMSHGDRVLVG